MMELRWCLFMQTFLDCSFVQANIAEIPFEDRLRYINEQDKFGRAPLHYCFPPDVTYTVEEDAVTNQRHMKATPYVPKPEELTENHQRCAVRSYCYYA